MNFLLEKSPPAKFLTPAVIPLLRWMLLLLTGRWRERRYRPVPVLAQERQRSAAMGIQVASAGKGSVMPLRPWRQKSTTQSGNRCAGAAAPG